MLEVVEGDAAEDMAIKVRSRRYVESDTALVNRILGREIGGKQNILVMNDEAHHAYRIKREEPDEEEEDFGEEEEAEEFFKEATVWVDGLDRIHKLAAMEHQLLRGPFSDALLPRPRRPANQSPVPLGSERLQPHGRHRVRAGEDSAACDS